MIDCPVHIARGEIALGSLVTDEDIASMTAGHFPLTSTQFLGVCHLIKDFAAHRFMDDLATFLTTTG